MAAISFKHEIQVAHRLWTVPGPCQNIHGHSMMVEIKLWAPVVDDLIGGWDFHDIKSTVRHYLDSVYDHHLLLNEKDPFAQPLIRTEWRDDGVGFGHFTVGEPVILPGLLKFEGDPTTENIAKCIWKWASQEFDTANQVQVTVQETSNTSITVDGNS